MVDSRFFSSLLFFFIFSVLFEVKSVSLFSGNETHCFRSDKLCKLNSKGGLTYSESPVCCRVSSATVFDGNAVIMKQANRYIELICFFPSADGAVGSEEKIVSCPNFREKRDKILSIVESFVEANFSNHSDKTQGNYINWQ